ncbi:hypothetical protein LEP1GSC020_3183 [Leptospira interrogans serovar Grippotyphosa str. 2006006986]|uniref:hypothetical protein n=1 Tax=Leptospira interrogans TaxID=173 RepID=UPI0002925967|nr:hypothetical protein [Leptospira interrogans]EKO89302.1 hypothetical protein LEP1GSC009_4146 [Leptospira interrogans serovar Grippotyphosa str. Andaman]EKP83801.1 hypothetical protein LEP1GSC020_3183 [Leptospira interrogans serovar Grippotyphosa str. 2006006986]UML85837.1 hypothetical protein FH587_10400 [Leptospira interrogans]
MRLICLALLCICACIGLQKTGNEAIYESAKVDVGTLPPSKEKRNIQKALEVCSEQNEELKELREENSKLKELANKWRGLRNTAIVAGIFSALGLLVFVVYKFRNLLGI